MIKNLVIWDFDGVIADSEIIWIKNRQEELNKRYNLNWDFETTNKYIGGMSDKSKREVLDSLGINTDDEFWSYTTSIDIKHIEEKGLDVFGGVTDIFDSVDKYCVATGGVFEKTLKKIKAIKMWGTYFNKDNLFTVDMVEKGKPEPDLFLFASE